MSEYRENNGGVYYYTQNKFGSDWVNKVDNEKGWTLDFNLRVSDIQNSDWIIDENNKGKGVGVYVNDGTKQETINFLTQQIIFTNANHTKNFDTTQEVDYRLTGKKDSLKLYSRLSGSPSYKEISDINFSTASTPNGNALNPSVFEDVSGKLHAVWWDDGGNVGSLFYSKFDNSEWSIPEKVVSLDNGVQFPSIIVDDNENIYVAFESKQTEGSVIGLAYKNNIGWSEPYYTGIDIGYCRHPKMTFDSQSNVCLVWEDHRRTHQEIYFNVFLNNELSWRGEEKLSNNVFGSYRPSITSYLDELFITWTQASSSGTSSIEIVKYNVLSSNKTTPMVISLSEARADFSNVLSNVSGRVFVVWHENLNDDYKIYSAILSPSLDILSPSSNIVEGIGGSRYLVLSEQLSTGDVYIIWQDFKSRHKDDPSGFIIDPYDPYQEQPTEEIELDSAIFIAVYKDGEYMSSSKGSIDVRLIFNDDRNSYLPAVPVFFGGELPIIYESYYYDTDNSVTNNTMLKRVRHAFYSLDRSDDEFLVNSEPITDPSGILIGIRDYILNKNISTKEIRFGDFSDVINSHYIFKNFRYYLGDAVEPYNIIEIGANTVGVDFVSAQDAVINNYGDVWIIGVCGIYYYFSKQNRVIKVGRDLLGIEDNIEDEDLEALKEFKAINFDVNNNMFIGGIGGVIRYSVNHFNGYKELSTGITGDITSLVFDKDNRMYVGTNAGLFAFDLAYSEIVEDGIPTTIISASLIDPLLSTFNNYPSGYITSLKIDVNNCLWIGSRNGVYRFFKDKFLQFTTTSGLPQFL